MKILKDMKNVVSKTKSKILFAVATSSAILMTSPVSAVTVNAGEANNKARAIADVVTYIFPLMGAFFTLSGLIKWVMAYRSDQPEQQASAAKEIVIGIVCVVFRVFLWSPVADVIFG